MSRSDSPEGMYNFLSLSYTYELFQNVWTLTGSLIGHKILGQIICAACLSYSEIEPSARLSQTWSTSQYWFFCDSCGVSHCPGFLLSFTVALML